MNGEAFTDLRLNKQEGQVNESFWPSFTDIMTTVVMIFLIAMVVLIGRNLELMEKLRSTMEAERIAAELARATGEEKNTLAMALHNTEEQASHMALEISRLYAKAKEAEALIADQKKQISTITAKRDSLNDTIGQMKLAREKVDAELDRQKMALTTANKKLDNRELELTAARSDIDLLKQSLAGIENNLEKSQETALNLQMQLTERNQEIELARQSADDMQRKYNVLSGDFDTLQVKYNKLIRPARTPQGRYYVEVRYWKEDGDYRLAWREAKTGPFNDVTRAELDQQLSKLAEQQKNGLYVRIIFPEDAGLTYNEAFELTSHLHREYDYYFRDEIPKLLQ